MSKAKEILKDIMELSREDKLFVLRGLSIHEVRVGDVRSQIDSFDYKVLEKNGALVLCEGFPPREGEEACDVFPGWEPVEEVAMDKVLIRGPEAKT